MNIYVKTMVMSLVAFVTCTMQAGNEALKREKAIQRAKKGLVLFKANKEEDAVRNFRLALAMPKLPSKYRAKVLYKLGLYFENLYRYRGAKALKCYQAVLAISELPNKLYAKAAQGIGKYYANTDDADYKKAEDYYQQAIKYYQAALAQPGLLDVQRTKILLIIAGEYSDLEMRACFQSLTEEAVSAAASAIKYFEAALDQPDLLNTERADIFERIGSICDHRVNFLDDSYLRPAETVNKQKALECYQSILKEVPNRYVYGCKGNYHQLAFDGLGRVYADSDNCIKADWKKSYDYTIQGCMFGNKQDVPSYYDCEKALRVICQPLLNFKNLQYDSAKWFDRGKFISEYAKKEMSLADIEYAVNYIIENFTKPKDKNA